MLTTGVINYSPIISSELHEYGSHEKNMMAYNVKIDQKAHKNIRQPVSVLVL